MDQVRALGDKERTVLRLHLEHMLKHMLELNASDIESDSSRVARRLVASLPSIAMLPRRIHPGVSRAASWCFELFAD